MRRVLLVLGLVALAAPAQALAHATIQGSRPERKQRVERAPRAVTVRFDQSVEVLPGSIEVRDARGRLVSLPARQSGPRAIAAPLRRISTGAYTVRWRALSASDGHVVSGVFTFGVRTAAPDPTEAYGAVGPTVAEDVVRWLYFAGLALLVGALGFRLLLLPKEVPAPLERRFYWIAGLGVVAVLEAGIVGLLLRAHGALQLPLVDFLYGDLSSIVGGTRLGSAFVATTLGFAVVAALLFLSWLLERRDLLWASLLVSLGLASGLSLSGHQAEDGVLSALADWVHLSAACLWAGGLVMLAAAVWPAAPALRRDAFLRFARLAPALIALVVAAGVYMSVLRLPRLDDLWSEGYGQVLLVKIALVSVALAWGGIHHFLVRPRLERAGAGIRRSLIGETAVGLAVLLVAAVLVNSDPPSSQPAPAPAQAATLRR